MELYSPLPEKKFKKNTKEWNIDSCCLLLISLTIDISLDAANWTIYE